MSGAFQGEEKQKHVPIALNERTHKWFEVKHDERRGVNGLKPPHNDNTWDSNNVEIFVGISSLHDNRCGRTLHSLITQARNPSRIHIGVVQQNDDTTQDCIDGKVI